MSEIAQDVSTAVLMLLLLRSGLTLAEAATPRRFPWLAVAVTAVAAAGLVLQHSWPGAADALDADPARSGWWRPVTSVFLQNSGIIGAVWNVATLAAVAALAEWHWGRRAASAALIAGILLPRWIGELVGGGPVDPRDFAGSSGATYFLAATLAGGAVALAGSGRLIALAAPAFGLLLWLTIGNAHGLVAVEGFILGVAGMLLSSGRTLPRRRAHALTDGRAGPHPESVQTTRWDCPTGLRSGPVDHRPR
jgi:hypothetical protein